MSDYTLVIGNKNYSSWSLRPWLAMRMARLDFAEELIPLDQPETRERILAHNRGGTVPVLIHGELKIPQSLAICEYIAERHPDAELWPADAKARAMARAASAEMASSFMALRSELPMNIRRAKEQLSTSKACERDCARIREIWSTCRADFGGAGDFLFGDFTIADAMYAPVVHRFEAYGVAVDALLRAYMDAVLALPPMREWTGAARAETWAIAADEV